MTHADLVARAGRWLKNTVRCNVVFVECSSQNLNEAPDAIGWTSRGHSTLVECKVSIGDFRADRAKPSRQTPKRLMGSSRYYMTPPGLLKASWIPGDWGLLEVHPRADDTIVRIVKKATAYALPLDRRDSELALLVAELFRISGGWRKPGDRIGLFVCDDEPKQASA